MPTSRIDPIRDIYYKPLETIEKFLAFIFYVAAALSFAPLFLDRAKFPGWYDAALTGFALLVIAYFVFGLVARYYFLPRAEDARRKEFLSNVFGVQLTHQRTVGYYNNTEPEINRRLMLCVLENSLFSKSVLHKMLPAERIKLLYIFVWIAALLWRATPLDWIVTATQVLFSEELIARWVRLEWLRMRTEGVFDKTLALIQSRPNRSVIQARAAEAFGNYECGKAAAGIVLSEKHFKALNTSVTQEWEQIKQTL